MRVIGTAGHVDHGKSTLVEALTNINPDRLKEEQEREMTIDLGFAWLTLPDGEDVGIIDVPGHRDFIENMLAGVGGIDATLFVVAADEGVMPQTREHLAILDILQIHGGVVALTKIDMVDEEWLDLVEEDVRSQLESSVLGSAPIIRVSGKTKEGVPELIEALQTHLMEQPPRPDLGRPRLPVDRVFSISGFGTVVTGTLIDGELKIGDEVVVLPGELKGRVRGLETHKHKASRAVPGSRTAVNITGIGVNEVKRGDIITHPGSYRTTQRLDVHFRLLPNASQALKHFQEVKLFIGATEVMARVRVLGAREFTPGTEGWLQIEPVHPIVAVRGDRFILRRPSPGETLGGGMVIDPQPKRRHKRFVASVLERLDSLTQGSVDEVIMQTLQTSSSITVQELCELTNISPEDIMGAVELLQERGEVISLTPLSKVSARVNAEANKIRSKNDLLISYSTWVNIQRECLQVLDHYHQTNPLRQGMSREELKSRVIGKLRIKSIVFEAVQTHLIQEGIISEAGPLVYLHGHEINFTDNQKQKVTSLMKLFEDSPYSPPSVKECQALVGESLYEALVDLGKLVQVSTEVVFRLEDYEIMLAELGNLFRSKGTLSAGEVRDHFQTSRKYTLALLEHLDAEGITIRQGDVRKLK